MPELPEVETIRRQLEKLIVGKAISSIEVLDPGSFRVEKDSLIGKSITRVGRKGKVLIIASSRGRARRGRGDLTGLPRLPAGEAGRPDPRVGTPRNDESGPNSKNLFIHLKMSGRLEFINRNISNPSKKARPFSKRPGLSRSKHLRIAIGFTNGSHLLFHDQRKFGWISDDPAVLPRGIDALDPALSPQPKAGRPLAEKKLAEILASSNRPVKTVLLDQSKIAGIGNIYASEILWQAGISPFRKGVSLLKQGDSLSEISEKFRKLLTAIREVLTDAIDSGGSTMDDQLYRHVSGQTGNYWSRRRVYDRAGQPCRRSACRKKNTVIQKTVIGQRSTYFCPSCQK